MKKELTEDETFRYEYIQLITKILQQCKSTKTKASLTPREKAVIEYHLKDVARHAVLEKTSTEECVALFYERIKRMFNGNKEEWETTLEFVRRHRALLNNLEIVKMEDLFQHFIKKRHY